MLQKKNLLTADANSSPATKKLSTGSKMFSESSKKMKTKPGSKMFSESSKKMKTKPVSSYQGLQASKLVSQRKVVDRSGLGSLTEDHGGGEKVKRWRRSARNGPPEG